jgi:hypothetical protein
MLIVQQTIHSWLGGGVDWVILAQVLSLVISLDNNSTIFILGNMPFFTCITSSSFIMVMNYYVYSDAMSL